jgi:hypothetical protein
MAKSYVGIVTPRGLESLVPETENAVALLMHRVYGKRSRNEACCWAVMPDAVARAVQDKLEWQRFKDALATMSAEAMYCGTILPSVYEDTS